MAYPSVDKLQNTLAAEVFGYAADKKKASGRALGTLIEIVTFYTLCAWGLRDATAIERPAPEFANPEITHNVEFSVHPIVGNKSVTVKPLDLPLTSKKLLKLAGELPDGTSVRDEQILSRTGVMRNSAVVAEHACGFTTAHIHAAKPDSCTVALTDLLEAPFAIFECKRVGVEEGMRKGPQTIEKAKQGAYVARSVSSLQKFRLQSGKVQGVLDVGGGKIRTGDYDALLRQVIDGNDADALRHFILTVGVVSNHGNWFTAENQNKELKVLAHSYDWLLFLTDAGLAQFIEKLLRNPVAELKPAKDAFLASYRAEKTGNSFTKVKIDTKADQALKRYFELHEKEVESWFNVIAPRGGTLNHLQADLVKLARKDWKGIRQP
ncbi:MAG: hypothetical protein J0L61_06105 [Planctomycetes bacterium]|nr:hypothetical protein [Planctomycetota bacterium]